MKICLLNETKSLFFLLFHKLIIFHFSPAGKKRAYLPLQTLRGKQKYQITNVGVEKIKLSHLLVQRINKFKMNEIQRKIPQQP